MAAIACPTCGYDSDGLPSRGKGFTCPECGTFFEGVPAVPRLSTKMVLAGSMPFVLLVAAVMTLFLLAVCSERDKYFDLFVYRQLGFLAVGLALALGWPLLLRMLMSAPRGGSSHRSLGLALKINLWVLSIVTLGLLVVFFPILMMVFTGPI